MTSFVHELLSNSAKLSPQAIALQIKDIKVDYSHLYNSTINTAQHFKYLGVEPGDRVGIYLAKNQENVESMFACSLLSAVFVPINPVLKAPQVHYILNDCQVKLLITNRARLTSLKPLLAHFENLETILLIDAEVDSADLEDITISSSKSIKVLNWSAKVKNESATIINSPIKSLMTKQSEQDLVAILYTSGSTGQPKGIMLSHTNIVLGAKSVNDYLPITTDDIILAVLPLSFDYGLNQLMSSFLAGATCVLFDYLLANDVIKAINRYQITGLAAVPPLWVQLTKAKWTPEATRSIRYYTNSGGALSPSTLEVLQSKMPQAAPYLMYGLTEAFRSTYLPPEQVALRPSSMGKAIPNSEILVLREDGSSCAANEVGELVHIGPLVTLGYWQNKAATSVRYRPTPVYASNVHKTPLAVFSGDYVKQDTDGFLYFVARKDTMIKTSGYRVSPTELEATLITLPQIDEVAVIASPSEELGQSITALIVCSTDYNEGFDAKKVKQSIIKHCQRNLPNYMVPHTISFLTEFPRNANGKIDTKKLSLDFNKTNATN